MQIQTFAAIYIGSYEISLKVFEVSSKKMPHEIDHIRSRLDLGREAISVGMLNYEMVDRVCDILSNFKQIMKGYKVEHYEVYASAAIRDLSNELLVLDQIYLRTGFRVKVLSNSEHRFISYKSVANKKEFAEMIKSSAAVVDIGGSSIQITLFRQGELVTTQHLDLGTMRLRSQFDQAGFSKKVYLDQMKEFINKKLEVLRSLYFTESVEHIIFMNDYCAEIIKRMDADSKTDMIIKAEKFDKFLEKLQKKSLEEICRDLHLANATDPLILPSIALFEGIMDNLGCYEVWVSEANINDGIAYDYAQRHQLLKSAHDFDRDVLSAARNLSEHYSGHSPHIEALGTLSGKIFDTMKKVHGLGAREKLLLEVAVLLHDCGKYISLANSSISAYNIIMESEIIGLSHREREIVALTVLYNANPLDDYEELRDQVDQEAYLVVAKLSAILRVANALDQSHKQKFKDIRITLKDKELVISVDALQDISLEQTLFENKTSYFESVYSIKPVLKAKKVYEYS